MKAIVHIIALLVVASPLFAQQPLKKALDNFHNTLAFTYHPMADDSNFAPIHKRSSELADAAAEVKRVSDSLGIKRPSLMKSVNQLAEQCRALDEAIHNGISDDSIRPQLTAIHSKFHELEDMVNGGEE